MCLSPLYISEGLNIVNTYSANLSAFFFQVLYVLFSDEGLRPGYGERYFLAEYSGVQYSTVQDSTVQDSTVQYNTKKKHIPMSSDNPAALFIFVYMLQCCNWTFGGLAGAHMM